jgi:Zn-dependent protease with chaperone function
MPPISAAWLVTAALLPKVWLDETAFEAAHPVTHLRFHLLGDLTAAFEPTLAFATLALATMAASFALWSSVRGYLSVSRVIDRLEADVAPPQAKQLIMVEKFAADERFKVGVVLSDYPFSFVWGFINSRLILSSGLLHVLNAKELAGLLEHEAAHHSRRDNLIRLTLTLLGHLSLAIPCSWLLLRWRAEQVEMICDEVAAATTGAPLEVADALVKLRRRTITAPLHAPLPFSASNFIPDGAEGFERRVLRILELAEDMPDPSRSSSLSRAPMAMAYIIPLLFVASLVLSLALAPLAAHRAAESLIQLIR